MFRKLAMMVMALLIATPTYSTVVSQPIISADWGKKWCAQSTDDNEVVIQTDDVSGFDVFMLINGAGAVDVFPSLSGANADSAVYATSALSLSDLGATDSNPVLVTAALRIYGFRGKYQYIRILQNGATDATGVCLIASKM